jgi:Fe2+ or Zn2+ uptake regulation protein
MESYEDGTGPDPAKGTPKLCAEALREQGLKATPQRIRILKFLRERDGHPTADEIYSTLKEASPSLSKTTVYNNLEILRQKGLVSVLTISPSEMRYEYGQDMHHHLLCDECGNIYDIDISCPYMDNMLHGEHKVKEVHGYFRGTCKDCLTAGAMD